MTLHRRIVVGACFFVVAGCASQDVIVQKQAEMGARLEQLLQSNTMTASRLAEVTSELHGLQEKVKAHAVELEQVKASQKELQANITDRLAQPSTPPTKIEVVNRDVPPKERESGPPQGYMKAFGLYSANNYGAAVEAFEAFLTSNPGSEYAANALYWIGECYYSQSNLPKALDYFKQVVEKYPKGSKAPDAMLKAGFTLYAMKESEKARTALESLVEKYPKSPAAAKARERMNSASAGK